MPQGRSWHWLSGLNVRFTAISCSTVTDSVPLLRLAGGSCSRSCCRANPVLDRSATCGPDCLATALRVLSIAGSWWLLRPRSIRPWETDSLSELTTCEECLVPTTGAARVPEVLAAEPAGVRDDSRGDRTRDARAAS
jgi:hypothetical protein